MHLLLGGDDFAKRESALLGEVCPRCEAVDSKGRYGLRVLIHRCAMRSSQHGVGYRVSEQQGKGSKERGTTPGHRVHGTKKSVRTPGGWHGCLLGSTIFLDSV